MSLGDLLATRSAVIIPDAIAGTTAVRERLAGFVRYALVDRGSYAAIDDPAEPELLAAVARRATEVTGRTLVVARSRILRLEPGDYILARHDPVRTERAIEVVLDLSPASVPGAEVHYRQHGQVLFRVPTVPGSLAIVPTNPTVSCNHTYVSKLQPAAVTRLVAVLMASAGP